MGPTGQPFTQEKARELATYDQLVLICGHYEGVDYRVEEHLVDETYFNWGLCINWWRIASYGCSRYSGSYDSRCIRCS